MVHMLASYVPVHVCCLDFSSFPHELTKILRQRYRIYDSSERLMKALREFAKSAKKERVGSTAISTSETQQQTTHSDEVNETQNIRFPTFAYNRNRETQISILMNKLSRQSSPKHCQKGPCRYMYRHCIHYFGKEETMGEAAIGTLNGDETIFF